MVNADGSIPVSPEVSDILYALSGEINKSIELARNGTSDWLSALESTSADLCLLASGSWGAGTRNGSA